MSDKTEIALMNQKLDDVVLKQKETKKEISSMSKVLNKIAIQQNDIKTLYHKYDVLYQQHKEDFGEGGVIDKIKTRQAACPVKEGHELAFKTDIDDLWRAFKWGCGIGISSTLILVAAILAVLAK